MSRRTTSSRRGSKSGGCLTSLFVLAVVFVFFFGWPPFSGGIGSQSGRAKSTAAPYRYQTARPTATSAASTRRPSAGSSTAKPTAEPLPTEGPDGVAARAAAEVALARISGLASTTAQTVATTGPPSETFNLTETLRKGDRSYETFLVQSRLLELGYTDVTRTGNFDDATHAAVIDFQRAHDLTADGAVGAMTASALFAGSSVAFATPTPRPTYAPKPTATKQPASAYVKPSDQTSYVINTSTGKFHRTSCSDIKKMKSSNRWDYTGSRQSVIDMGYVPCKHCYP